ncbi:hypothetical protein Tco_0512786, partial [Tanacetum coccineum]
PLTLPSIEENVKDTGDKSLSRTVVHPASKPKAKTDKKQRTKKTPSSSEPQLQILSLFKLQIHKPLNLSSLKKQRSSLTPLRV